MLDCLIRGGSIIDGSGAPAARSDVGIRDGRIALLGAGDEPAAEVVDADGLVVAPGFIDLHTHYDAQLLWDPLATPSSLHGVTTVIGGNCGFTLAPLAARDADYVRRMMATVEQMPLEALEHGIDWEWESFAEYLGRLRDRLGVNAGFFAGHSSLRRYVLGSDHAREASDTELQEMRRVLGESIEAGALGFSTSLSFTHRDEAEDPVPSRFASNDEVLALCSVLADHDGTSIEFITDGCLNGFSDDEIKLMTQMSLSAGRTLMWNVFSIDANERERFERNLLASEHAAARGARVVALTMPNLVDMNMSFLSRSPIFQLPGWGEILNLPLPERLEKLRDPEVRRVMDERAHSPEAGIFARFNDWGGYRIGETYSEANAGLEGRRVADIAAERGTTPFDTLLDVSLADDLRALLWPKPTDDDEASWALREKAWENEHVVFGGSDAGAHVDSLFGAPYTTLLLEDCLRGARRMSLPRAIHELTEVPARLMGLHDRGRVAEGYRADLVLLDPERVGMGEIRMIDDLPRGAQRLFADARGIERVIVNGRPLVIGGEPTGELPGQLLAPGRDTRTTAP